MSVICTFDLRILAMLCVVKRVQALLTSRVNLMVGRLAGRLLICGGRIVTGTIPTEGEICRGVFRGAFTTPSNINGCKQPHSQLASQNLPNIIIPNIVIIITLI